MDHKVVILSKDGSVKILHGIDPDDYMGRKDVLIDPVFPPGVPPHLWKLSKGRIEGSRDKRNRLPSPISSRERLLIIILSIVTTLNLFLLLRHIW